MATNYKNIVITPNIGNTADPRIQFSGGNTTVNTDINLYVYPSSNGTLSFEGSAGQLFSVTNDLTGTIFSVNDVSGIPSIDVNANGLISIAPFGGNVVFGNTAEVILSPGTGLYANGGLGTAGQVLHSNGTSVYWAADDNSGTVTSVASANGIGGGTITATGTLYAVAGNSTVFVNATGIHVNTAALPADGVTSVASGNGLTGGTITGTGTLSALANTGIVANSTGLFVNATYISSIAWPINGAATDANTATQGIWRLNTGIPNQPSGTDYGTLLTFDNNSDTGFQLASDYAGSNFYWRSGNPAVFGGAGSFATWKKLLHDSNYNSYAPTLTGTGASGTWGINVTGSAGSASTATNASYCYNYTQGFASNWNTDFNNAPAGSMILRGDTSTGSSSGGPGGTWWFQQNYRHTNGSNTWGVQVAWGWEDNANLLRTRNVSANTYGSWVTYLNSSNYNSYSPTLTGTGASGNWGINITGSAASLGGVAASNYALDTDIIGQQTIWVPASAMYGRTTNGSAPGTVETATNRVMIKTLDFDTTTQEFAQFAIQMPKSWNEGTIICQFIWSHAATTTNFGVVWQIQAAAFADNNGLDALAFGTAVTATDTGGTTNNLYISPETSEMTVAGSPTAEEYIVFQVARVPANASDTLAIDARLHGVKIHYTTDAAKDD